MANRRIKVRPGKTQSKFAFFVGIAFVLFGVIVAIPTFGLFGILWTCVAGFICYSHFQNAFTDEGIPTYEISVDETEDIEMRLRQLDKLYNDGLITRDEYENKRQEILSEI